MKLEGLIKRIEALEEPKVGKIRLVWYSDEDYNPDDDDPSHIRLKWYDELTEKD